MMETQYAAEMPPDRAPGDAPAVAEEETSSGMLAYTIGLLLAVILTATSFWVVNTSLLWGPGVHLGLAVLAIAQMGVHLVFFLHISTGPDSSNNVLAVAFGLLIAFLVVVGSLCIMADLNTMMPAPETKSTSSRTSSAAGSKPNDVLARSLETPFSSAAFAWPSGPCQRAHGKSHLV